MLTKSIGKQMNEWISWAIVMWDGSNDELKEQILAVPGVIEGKNLPLYSGTLEDFAKYWKRQFIVSYDGFWIAVTHLDNLEQGRRER